MNDPAPKKEAESLKDMLALKPGMLALLSMVLLVGAGEHLGERFLPLYLTALGGGAWAVGMLSGLDNLLSALYSFPGGWLSDRIGAKKALIVFNLMSIFGYLLVLAIPAWWAVLLGAFFFISWSAISLPATMDLTAKLLPQNKRTMGVSMHALMRRIPKALGPLMGGLFIHFWGLSVGVRVAFAVAAVLALTAAVIQQKMIPDDAPKERKPTVSPLALLRDMNPSLRNLLISDVLIRFCEQIPDAFVVLWCVRQARSGIFDAPLTEFEFAFMTTIEMATAMLVYIPVARWSERVGKKPFVLATFVFFSLFPLVLMFCRDFWTLVPAFVLRGLKEFGEPTRKALILELAPADRRAATFGVYYLARDIIVTFAAVGGAVLWHYFGPTATFLTAFGFGALGTAWFAWRGHDVEPAARR
jgi:MFS family permease